MSAILCGEDNDDDAHPLISLHNNIAALDTNANSSTDLHWQWMAQVSTSPQFPNFNISKMYQLFSSLCDNWGSPPVDAQESFNSNPDLAAACVYVCRIVLCCSRGLYWQSYLNVIPVFTPPSLDCCRHLSATWPHTDTNCFLHRVKSRNPTRRTPS